MVLERLKLDGKVALVTGAGKGIGRGIASVLAEAGAKVVVTARTAEDIRETVRHIESLGGTGLDIVADITRRADSERVVDTTIEHYGRLDILINNAGGGEARAFFDITEDDLHHDFHLNTVSTFSMTQLAAPHMIKAGGGSVVNISSRSANFVASGRLPYGVAKAALEHLTRIMALELAPTIRVNAIGIGTVMTPALRGSFDLDLGVSERNLLSMIPLHTIGDVEDVGLAVLYLCADKCYATGTVLNLDGGLQTNPRNLQIIAAA